MPNSRLAFDTNLELDEIAAYHQDAESGFRILYSALAPDYVARFAGQTRAEVEMGLINRLSELDKRSCLVALTSLEAHFRIDFDLRCSKRLKDDLSRHFRQIAKRRRSIRKRVRLDEEILNGWRDHTPIPATLIATLRGAFKFRHWLAHGRYWVPKLGGHYDFVSVNILAKAVVETFPFEA